MSHIVHPVILCGGSGTRLWPLSTPEMPKQFKALTSEKSMIEETADRFVTSSDPSLSFTTPLVVGSVKHRHLLEQTLPDARKILEPFGRNSAPAVAAACLASEPDDLILILPADHSIRDVPAFHLAIAAAAKAAEGGAIVTFGIEPTHPATGYGYIKAAQADELHMPVPVEKFVEKPDPAVAQSYLDAGGYYWNAGIFLFRADTMLKALEAHAPEVLAGTRAAMPADADNVRCLNPKAFAETPSISIDYAVMERAENVQTVPVDMAWSDVGGYPALHGLLTESASDNHTHGPVLLQNAHGMYVRSEGPTVAVNGVSNLVVVATKDEVVITPMEDAQAVKTLGAGVQTQRHALGLPTTLVDDIRNWLWTAFDVWSERAWDSEQGGFVEQLSMEGEPDLEATRRVRVQARQIFSFAKAIEMGWPGADKARELVELGVNYLNTKLRHPDGGWVHTVSRDGTPVDDRRDLYDHAFIILAGATAYRVTGNELALQMADDAIAFIDAELKDPEHGGWFESIPNTLPRRANPHMHLLEAMLAYHAATRCEAALKRASECVRLFETRFFNPATDVMAECFTEDWRVETSDGETVFEPGHHYEWATLLLQYEQLAQRDVGSWRRRLILKANASGVEPKSKFALNAVRANGTPKNERRRLWHQLEMFRAYLNHPATIPASRSQRLLSSIKTQYLDRGPTGGWLDETGSNGMPVSQAVPASMLYHIVTSIEML
ncbi:MAG: AGE family epimerase/isomerase [Alphaproteobacteria bacterium]|nr:AGE family epimerase/isomerase [Alphaproteobacteria bacterium]